MAARKGKVGASTAPTLAEAPAATPVPGTGPAASDEATVPSGEANAVQASQAPSVSAGEQPAASTALVPEEGARWFPVLHALDWNRVQYAPGDRVLVNEPLFLELRAAQVFEGDWDDGELAAADQ